MLAAARQPRVIVDVEITVQDGTWERSWNGPNDHKEIVQIGAVKINPKDFSILDRFEMLVRPHWFLSFQPFLPALTASHRKWLSGAGFLFLTLMPASRPSEGTCPFIPMGVAALAGTRLFLLRTLLYIICPNRQTGRPMTGPIWPRGFMNMLLKPKAIIPGGWSWL
jgi:hypothetical protein